jgi:hypothetical protein
MPVFWLASTAEQVTLVVPIGNVEPEGGEQFTEGLGSQLSVTETVKET